MKQKPPEPEKRQRILNAFIELIGETGAHQVTLQKAAKRAKVSFSTAHYYFGGDWNVIFTEAVTYVANTAQEYTTQYLERHSSQKSDPLEVYINATFQWIIDLPDHARMWLFNLHYSSLNPNEAALHEQFIERAQKRLLRLLHEAKGKKNSTFTSEPNLDLAKSIHLLVYGAGIMAIIQNKNAKKVNQIKKSTLAGVNGFLNKS